MDAGSGALTYDVVVAGAGIAGLSAAVEAAERGASVALLEKAPIDGRGGNTRFSEANIRAPHPADEYSPVTTTVEQFIDDFVRVTGGRANAELIRVMAEGAVESLEWLTARGISWAPGFPHTATYRRKPLGGGLAIVDGLFARAEELGISIQYETAARSLVQDERGRVTGVRALGPNGFATFTARGGVVLATGSFSANPEMRVRYLGPWAEGLIVRGSRYDTGEGLEMALALGAQPTGQWGDYHSAVLDAQSPRIEAGVTALYIYQLGVIVNAEGRRFLDEGVDFRDNTYVIFSKAMIRQPGGICYCILDQQARRDPTWERAVFTVTPPVEAESLEALAEKIGVPGAPFAAEIEAYNAAVDRATPFDPDRRDGKTARPGDGRPDKSNWALPIEEPPFLAFPVTGGITFAFGGLQTDADARVIDTRGKVIPGLYAAGETQGEIFYDNYPGATSVLRGCVFGRRAARACVASAYETVVSPVATPTASQSS
ncbi:MAG: FAD-dependent tricarballylate dehydrogenase TcuA [Chloroflexi bacterium]|nr:FAD-dependent tricarballylate dehydrogenase TcuA [Chloroflexota bacterium]